MIQLNLFTDAEKEALKRGLYWVEVKPGFKIYFKAFAKTLDKRLVLLGYEILGYLAHNKKERFNPKIVFNGDHHKIADIQKLHYWNFIRKTRHSGWWEFTQRGRQFFYGEIKAPKRVWVLKNVTIDESDKWVAVYEVDERWSTVRSDWALDFMPIPISKLPI